MSTATNVERARKPTKSKRKLTKENKNGDKNSDLNAGIKKFTDFVAESRGMEMKFLTSLTEILTPEQLAKYIIFERNFRKELRELLRRP